MYSMQGILKVNKTLYSGYKKSEGLVFKLSIEMSFISRFSCTLYYRHCFPIHNDSINVIFGPSDNTMVTAPW